MCALEDQLNNRKTHDDSVFLRIDQSLVDVREEDQEILKQVVEVLPGRSLARLELSNQVLKVISNSLPRCEASISSRWRYSLRTWLIQHYSKNNKSWNNLGKASVNRRKDVANYFNKLIKKKGIMIGDMNASMK